MHGGEDMVGIIGLGYVGLPLALRLIARGFTVRGLDSDPCKVDMLRQGRSYMHHIDDAQLTAAGARLTAGGDFASLRPCAAVLICVPTPLGPHHEPDMRFVEATGRQLGAVLRAGQLVVLKSTTYPGTTCDLLRPLLEAASGLTAGRDFYLAYAPERENPGPRPAAAAAPQVIGGLTPACRQRACALYDAAGIETVAVSSTQVAEMSKLLENVFRSVNIALVNELKLLCHAMELDVWEVIGAAATKPFGFMPFRPGPGLGGHCIPVDPFYLAWKARAYRLPTRFVELAGEINAAMPHYVLERIAWALNRRRLAVNGSRVMVLGVAYKPDVDDMREAPALRLMALLQGRGAEVCYHDPLVRRLPRTRAYDFGLASEPLDAAHLARCDAVVIVTDHSAVDYALVVAHAPVVVDTRDATRGVPRPRDNVVMA